MAIYEFECGVCETVVEKIQPFQAPPPTCCETRTRRLISMPAEPQIYGPGSYATEYGNKPHHLKPKDQRLRARREWHERDLMVAQPCKTSPELTKHIRKSGGEY